MKFETIEKDEMIERNHKTAKAFTQHKIESALISHAYKQCWIGLVASLLSATIVLVGLIDIPNAILLTSWYGILVIVLSLRFLTVQLFLKKNPSDLNLPLWRTIFILGTFCTGLCWGFLGSVLLPYQSLEKLSLTLFVLACVTAGAVPHLSSIKLSVHAFLFTSLLPLLATFLFSNQPLFKLFAGALIIYLVYLILLSARTHSFIKNAISLRYENDILLEDLTRAKTELEASNIRLEHAARHDPLTNLANRSLFEINFQNAIWRAQKESKIVSLLYLDIDNFKAINDIYGHTVGDQLLQKVVERLKRKLSENVIASRLGGDELTIILENVKDLEEVTNLCRSICETIAKPFEINDFHLQVTTSIGVSFYPVDGTNAEMLIKSADKAMYRSKDAGGNTFHFNSDFTTLKFALSNAFKQRVISKDLKGTN